MKEFIKPARLHPGDTVAALSPSYGAPYKYPHVFAGEFGGTDIPIVANMDFGHTDPQWVLPLGVIVEIEVDVGPSG